MSFAAPAFAWALLALIPLAAVYLIRVRPRRRTVNAFFLWEKVFEQRATNSFFQKLRQWLSLLLLALAFLAAVFSLMKPKLGNAASPDLLIVIDRSASMQGGGATSRLDLAKDRARGWIAALDGDRRAALATADTHLEYLAHLTGNARELRDALAAIEPSDLPLRASVMDELGLLAAMTGGDAAEDDRVRVMFLTDGRTSAGELPPGVERVIVGDAPPGPNAGITAADLRWHTQGEARLFVSVFSDFPEARDVELELVSADDGRLARLFTMVLAPDATTSESIAIEGVEPGAWELRLNLDDDFAADNVVALGLNAPQPVPVQVVSANPFFFQQVVSAFARANAVFVAVEDGGALGLADGAAPPTDLGMVFAPEGESLFWTDAGEELPPAVPEILVEDHPLIALLDPALLEFIGARSLQAPPGSVVVLAHPDGTPLLYTAAVDGRRMVVANLNPLRGDFFISPWFPVLVHEAAAMLTGRGEEFPSAVATGGRVEVPGTGPVERAAWQPVGGGNPGEVGRTSPLAVDRAGHYALRRGGVDWWTGGGVLAPGESGAALRSAGDRAAAAVPNIEPASGLPLALWLLGIAMVVILLEEILYHRSKVG